jgi:radical SAM protein with 4Fe4S-binding SPASM domain
MSLDTFKKVIDKIPSLQHIDLFNWGEPFLNPDIFNMIRYAKENNIVVEIHTNFSFTKNDDFFRDIISSGLDRLWISLDGATQETYSQYRVNGDFSLALSNIRTLAGMKARLGSRRPDIIWKFIVNKYNEHEIDKARNMIDVPGVRFFPCNMMLSNDLLDVEFEGTIDQRKERWLPANDKYIWEQYKGKNKIPIYNRPCEYLFTTLVVNPDGKVAPCCMATDESTVFGDLMISSMEDIWNNNKYQSARALFIKRKHTCPQENTLCSRCMNYKKICTEEHEN